MRGSLRAGASWAKFSAKQPLKALLPDLFEHANQALSAEDTLRFLGRKLHGNLLGEVSADHKRRPEGRRVRFRMKRNSIKMYDKYSVLRIETTINNPYEFKVRRPAPGRRHRRSLRWLPMCKGVANFWRYSQVGMQSNARFLEAIAHAKPQRQALDQLDRLSRSRTVRGQRFARFNPVSQRDASLFAAALAGQFTLNGFRNRQLTDGLYPYSARSAAEAKRRRERTSRLIAKMRGHGLVAKVPRTRLYRVTPHGQRVMAAALRFRHIYFAEAMATAA